MMRPRLLKAAPLRKGQAIGLICPASAPLKPGIIEGSIRYFEARGYPVKLGANARKKHGYLAGTDEERADDFNQMARDPEIRAILAIRGGYGTPRILPLIDYGALRRDPKIIAGFSDVTALQLAILSQSGLVTFSGACPGVELWKGPEPYAERSFWKALRSTSALGAVKNPAGVPIQAGRPGSARGPLICANLSLLVNLLGTPFLPDLRGAILLIEDVGEEPYRVDRMLTQLRNAGVLEIIAGLVLGTFTHCVPKDRAKPSFTIGQVLEEFIDSAEIPSIVNLQYGHIPRKLTLPAGITARLDAGRRALFIEEPALE